MKTLMFYIGYECPNKLINSIFYTTITIKMRQGYIAADAHGRLIDTLVLDHNTKHAALAKVIDGNDISIKTIVRLD